MLDPRVWIIGIISVILACTGGYLYGRHDGTKLTEARWVEASAKAQRLADDKYDAAQKKIDKLEGTLKDEQENSYIVARQRDDAIRSGAIKLYVPTVSPVAEPGGTGIKFKETRTELDPAFAIRVFAITDEGDRAIRDLNVCIDAYEAVRIQYGSNRTQ